MKIASCGCELWQVHKTLREACKLETEISADGVFMNQTSAGLEAENFDRIVLFQFEDISFILGKSQFLPLWLSTHRMKITYTVGAIRFIQSLQI